MTRNFVSVLCALRRPVLGQPVDKMANAQGKSHWSMLAKELRENDYVTLQFYSGVRDRYLWSNQSLHLLWVMFLMPGGALQCLTKWKHTTLKYIAESPDPGLTASTRSGDPCSCRICSTARVIGRFGMKCKKDVFTTWWLKPCKIFSLFELIRNIWKRRVKVDAALAWLYYFDERHYCQRILAFSEEFQQQEVLRRIATARSSPSTTTCSLSENVDNRRSSKLCPRPFANRV